MEANVTHIVKKIVNITAVIMEQSCVGIIGLERTAQNVLVISMAQTVIYFVSLIQITAANKMVPNNVWKTDKGTIVQSAR